MKTPGRLAQLTALHAEIRACRKCLDAGHAITPGGIYSGGLGARIMIVGQAPGVTEVVALRPFNASAGKRLFQWLSQAGFDETEFRATQYITSVTKCYPGKMADGRGDRRPSKDELALCRPYLDQTLALVRPEVIILVGALAIETLLGKYKLDAIIGHTFKRPAPWNAGHSTIFLPLPHPSGASAWTNAPENQALIQKAIRALKKLKHDLNL